ncbi:MAG TPA: transposase, partial [Anaerolineae bacterium]|nr:transposase [Anaerolineae bacterium]
MRKRRTFTSEFKAKVVMQNITGERSASEICREHRLSPVLFSRWKSEFIA